MNERVGTCTECGKELFCRDGFLDGVVGEDKELYCFDCAEDVSVRDKGNV
ncbi:hypothetical protein [Alkalihalobacillus sp. CinArs1]|nr:hypothetical protein [Alkalihalobacillus sp. CinArs1]